MLGEKRLSVLEGFLLQARVGRGYPWGGLGWVQLRSSCQQQSPHGLSESQLPLAVTSPVRSIPRESVLAHLGALQVGKAWPAVGLRLCGTTGEGTEIRCWLPAIHQPRNKENFKKQRLSLQANLFSEAGKELRRVCDAVSRIIYK